jgi:ribA/ribD-fused uncharacterized protein
MKNENFVFFWNGPFSQWYPSTFKEEFGPTTYNCAEQYMMYKKAILFEDYETAEKILAESSPREQKKLGRNVKNFDPEFWDGIKKEVVYVGNKLKFTQNPHLLEKLLEHDGTFVEASPFDKIWGVGLAEDNPDILDRAKWKGENLLGQILTELKDELKNK